MESTQVPGTREDRSSLRALPNDIRGNLLLGTLQHDEAARLEGMFRERTFSEGQTIVEAGREFPCLLFPESLITSVLVQFRDGSMAEVSSIGREGAIGISAALGASRSDFLIRTRIGGTGLELPMTVVPQLPEIAPRFYRSLLRAANFQTFLVAQISACNRLHDVQSRLARWYLLTDDRIQTRGFHITQDELGQLLGVRRASVSLASQELVRAGAIAYTRGEVRVLDREKLERAACDCYVELRHHLQMLLGLQQER